MISHRCQHNLILVQLKIEPDKEYIRLYLLFCFQQEKSTADAHRIICEMYGENVVAIEELWNMCKLF